MTFRLYFFLNLVYSGLVYIKFWFNFLLGQIIFQRPKICLTSIQNIALLKAKQNFVKI
ncbi:hypothetical protein AAJ76_2600011763 [Vairimorpha ceranae]|uniref:Uncharacterized protein n=1 Tax=Vairimorpha ceranae TaxID=40302 RepID=A0A0F9WEP8_9MICR|nr:hypothetical protein AAJ76_2600011763 [Vairimorpha ceranae]KKO75265.1 hypothetical protein AAJ76_2600011763 [Vairimorpha ceranae]